MQNAPASRATGRAAPRRKIAVERKKLFVELGIRQQSLVQKALRPSRRSQDMEKIGRNEPCPCGSGKKYKCCCLAQDLETERTALAAA